MGLFSRKTDKEIIAEGKDLFYKGDFAAADKKLMKLAIKGNDEACYWVGRISVETGAKHHDRKRIDIGRSFLEKAAKKGNRGNNRIQLQGNYRSQRNNNRKSS